MALRYIISRLLLGMLLASFLPTTKVIICFSLYLELREVIGKPRMQGHHKYFWSKQVKGLSPLADPPDYIPKEHRQECGEEDRLSP